MYAIVQHGGRQYRVAPGDRLLVDRLGAEVGSVIALGPVVLVHDGDSATIGAPAVEGARVAAVVVAHRRGRKLRVFKYKAKKRYRRTIGYRSQLTELRVEALLGKGEPMPTAAAPEVVAAPEAPEAAPAEKPKPAPRRRRPRAEAQPAEVASAPAEPEATAAPAEEAAAEPDAGGAAPEAPTKPAARRVRRTAKPAATDAETGES